MREQYAQHLETCEECRNELKLYMAERERLYSGAVLEEPTSPALDNEILRVCSNKTTAVTGVGLFGALVKKPVAVAVLFLAIGLGTGTYVAYHADNSQRLAEQPVPVDSGLVSNQDSAAEAAAQQVAAETDSGDSLLADSAGQRKPFPRDKASSGSEGVVPVDLQK